MWVAMQAWLVLLFTLSRDGELNKFGPLSRAQREEIRCCRSWGTVRNKGEPHEISVMQQHPRELVPCVFGSCDVVLWSWKEKRNVLVPEMYSNDAEALGQVNICFKTMCIRRWPCVVSVYIFIHPFSVVQAWLHNNITSRAAHTNQFSVLNVLHGYSVGYRTYPWFQ